MARTWERENEKKLVIKSYRKVCPCCHLRDIYQEMRFLFYLPTQVLRGLGLESGRTTDISRCGL